MTTITKTIEVKDLSIQIKTDDGILPIVDNVSFHLAKGETMALVGESGCGKSITSLALTKLLPSNTTMYPTGSILFEGNDLLKSDPNHLRSVRGREISYVFQEPFSALNPLHKIGNQLIEGFLLHGLGSKEEAERKVVYLLERVGITDAKLRLNQYPNQFSGGMLQRVCIAMALMCDPKILIADEPTSAIDVTIQLQLIELLKELRKENGMSVLFISHDIGLVSHIADRIAVMYAGKIIEQGTVGEIIDHPKHPYTKALIAAYPTHENIGQKLVTIEGIVPSPKSYPTGCRFHTRCPEKLNICDKFVPSEIKMTEKHSVDCFLFGGKESA
ncbi:ABC transporter ATP-binding protein [Leptospira harrisiae]|uniref:Dipeptide/oligopeptide/nickel ABC transporter ATP-binding protein n=1 Tax=Leptospira harrisiae TaxID=2023189 RepID=A0A2N0AKJ0_9LEPT|nr:ABC transporter ATP-binding protein [Leptospira harrisiae]PJZ84816.1 dipeptide/oligopeptide/nickel ABC transporter ATP-binding protein [Leptospira harrisiae]PKA08318.1 dipeptide/oligopeptide/nickel ABC transporter ATP-binding protein [Leptospira harrisiae]